MRVTVAQARRIALAAQGFAEPRPTGAVNRRHFGKLFRQMGLLQLDSVNVLTRSHYLPVLARLGPYDRARLDQYTYSSGEIWEYWTHMASLLPMDDYPLHRYAMAEQPKWKGHRRLVADRPELIEQVYEEVAAKGPLSASDLDDPGERSGPWWGYGEGKQALEVLYLMGRVVTWRAPNFGRRFDITERMVPRDVLEAEPISKEEAYRQLLMRAAAHHGIGTASDLADYHRLNIPTARPVLELLADEGALLRVEVPGWRGPVYLHPDARRPRQDRGTALLSPFDPVVWERDRTERLFDFRYRIEIYVPEKDRIHGYYVLPFLLDGDLAARVDLKADRQRGRLLVKAAWIEPGYDPARVVAALHPELATMAVWLGLSDVEVERRGDLSGPLAGAS